MKTCFECGIVKSPDGFYKWGNGSCKRNKRCKECVKRRVKSRAERLSKTDLKWLELERERCRIKIAEDRSAGKPRQTSFVSRANWRKKNKVKVNAATKAKRAAETGKIVKKKHCEICGATRVRLESHHGDYSKPLKVQTLCCKCHGLTKRKVGLRK